MARFGNLWLNRHEQDDYQSGWDTDQFPNAPHEAALAYYEVLMAGGFTTGGTNFDAKLRRQSLDPEDLIAAHVGGMDMCARGLKGHAMMEVALWKVHATRATPDGTAQKPKPC